VGLPRRYIAQRETLWPWGHSLHERYANVTVEMTRHAPPRATQVSHLTPSVSLQLAEAEVAAAPQTSDWWNAVTLRAMHLHIYVVMATLVLLPLLASDTSVLNLGYLFLFVLFLCFFDKVRFRPPHAE
jgi:hypothetical protein